MPPSDDDISHLDWQIPPTPEPEQWPPGNAFHGCVSVFLFYIGIGMIVTSIYFFWKWWHA